jgi:uncharacterized protein (TIGR00725 family)
MPPASPDPASLPGGAGDRPYKPNVTRRTTRGVPPPRAWIAVVGASDATPDELERAEEVGAAVADAGAGLVCGGLGGVMEAACRGARSRAGLTVGLLPGTDREAANGWVLVALPTGLGEARNALVVRAADALVAIGGGWGTLSEIALALRTGVPVVGLGTWELALPGGRAPGAVDVGDRASGAVHAGDRPSGAGDPASGALDAGVPASGAFDSRDPASGVVRATDPSSAVAEALRLAGRA